MTEEIKALTRVRAEVLKIRRLAEEIPDNGGECRR
jgi:hypothetical protein